MEVRGQQVLLRFKRLRATLDGFFLECTSEFHLLQALCLQGFIGLDFGCRRVLVRLHNKNAVIELMNPERHLVLRLMGFAARFAQFGGSHVICGLDLPKLGKRLSQRSAAGDKRVAALVQDDGPFGKRRPANRPQGPRGNANKLRVRNVRYIAVVAKNREIGASSDVFAALFFLNAVSGDSHDMIVLERELNGLLQRDVARLGLFGFLRTQLHSTNERAKTAKKGGTFHHDLVLSFAAGCPSRKPSSP